jgi:hypothetical protein
LTASDVQGLSEKAVTDHEVEERYRTKRLAEALASVLRTPKETPTVNGTAIDEGDDRVGENNGDAEDNGDNADPLSEDEELNTIIAEIHEARRLAGAEGLGEGKRKLSWVWVAGLQFEDLNDSRLLGGSTSFAHMNTLCELTIDQDSVWSSQSQGLVVIDGWRKQSSRLRKCGEM